MARPSRNLDRVLIAAGRVLLPEFGCGGLTIRQVAESAGVNIGMFHYHFKTREAFLRAVMQETYEEMFMHFRLEVDNPRDPSPGGRLRAAFRVLGRFLRDNRKFIARVIADALSGDAIARDFLKENLPRHARVLAMLIAEGQRRGDLLALPLPQALGFCAGSIAMPILAGGAIVESGALPKALARTTSEALLSNAAIDQRIDLALAALSAPASPKAKKGRKK